MATTPQKLRDTIQFEYNVPVEVALKFPTGKAIANRKRVMFSTTDDRVIFLDLGPAQRINELKPRVGEKFFLCKYREGRNVTWTAWLSPASEKARALEENPEMESDLERQLRESLAAQGRTFGEQEDGTFVVPKVAGASVSAPAPVNESTDGAGQGSRTTSKTHSTQNRSTLIEDSKALVDAFAAVLEYSSDKYGIVVKADDVRTLVITAHIQRERERGRSYAA